MTEQQHDILNRYEESLRTTLVKRLTDSQWLAGLRSFAGLIIE